MNNDAKAVAPKDNTDNSKDAERFRKISDAFNNMKTSRAETFASLLGFNEDSDYLEDLGTLIDRIKL